MNFGTDQCVRVASFDIPYSRARQRRPGLSHPVWCKICNLEFQDSRLIQHRSGVMHQQAQRIKALLHEPCITHAEIAERLGVTRERIRQIANQFACEVGQVRKKACAIQTSLSRALPPKIEAIRKLAAEHGLTCEPVKKNLRGWRWRWSSHRMIIAGHPCSIRTIGQNKRNPFYLHLWSPHGLFVPDFALYLWQDGAFVVPRERFETIKGYTIFVFGRERGRSGRRSAQHDWPSFWNAWHLLRPRSSVLAEKRGDTGLGPSAAPEGEADEGNVA